MSISQRIKAFLDSPRGRRLVERGQAELSKPENQVKIRRTLDKIRKR
ncbi:hypothetical protein FHX74_001028 [Friedmanniella endophytica]|uniref:Uncharacterized protein n=1 Tax=Microlunatus kandeliicorticis TaxID=1759536 RepID=A0A7W3P4Z4_9ACTN|nr:hypothetical protein [Microlunatus kandeliicorticis]MBA8793423.1 hypothetical protein [Microlunatus kandeliicorticis]